MTHLTTPHHRTGLSLTRPGGAAGVLICDDEQRTRASIARVLGAEGTAAALDRFHAWLTGVAEWVFGNAARAVIRADASGSPRFS